MKRLKYVALIAVLLVDSAMCSDTLSPEDPSFRFERLLRSKLAAIESTKANATFFVDDIETGRSMIRKSGLWTDKEILNVCFWNGSENEKKAVIQSAAIWNTASRLQLSFTQRDGRARSCVRPEKSEIRISLSNADTSLTYEGGQDKNGNWSLIGRQSIFVPIGQDPKKQYDVTMNLPHVGGYLEVGDLKELNFTVRHEFGHALGLFHEFQSEVCTDWINIKKFADDNNWYGNSAKVNLEPLPTLTGKLKVEFTKIGPYDVNSVMQYNFPLVYYCERPPAPNPCKRSKDIETPSPDDIKTLVSAYGPTAKKTSPGPSKAFAGDSYKTMSGLYKKQYDFAQSANRDTAGAVATVKEALNSIERFSQGIVESN